MIQVNIDYYIEIGRSFMQFSGEQEVTTPEDPPDTLKVSHLQQPTVCQLGLLLYTTWSRWGLGDLGGRDTNRTRWEASVKPL